MPVQRPLLLLPEKAFEQLGSLFHDRHVGGPARIHHAIGAELSERGDDPALQVFARTRADALTDRHAHGGRELHDGRDCGIVEPVERAVGLILDGQGAGRAYERALAALDAGLGLAPGATEAHRGVGTRMVELDDADALHLAAGLDAAKAADALVGREDEAVGRGVRLDGTRCEAARKARDVKAHDAGDLLQLAGAVARAARAGLAVVREEELRLELLHAADLVRVGIDDVALDKTGLAGRHHAARAVGAGDLDEAHAASARTVIERRKFAKRRNEGARAPGDF